jgi:general secretion pathway protein D
VSQIPETPEIKLEPPTRQDRLDARQPLPPTELAATNVRRDFDVTGDGRKVFEDVARAFGLDCIFDRDYQNAPPFRFRLDDVDYRDALHALEAATSSFIVPITEKIFLVSRDTPQKRQELEPNIAVAIKVEGVTTPQDLTAMVTAIQQTFAVERVGWDSQNNTVFLRGPISKVLPARAMFDDLMNARAQVMVELKFIETSRNDILTYGIRPPTVVAIMPQVQRLSDLVISSNTMLIGFSVVAASIVAEITKSNGSVVLESEFRSADGVAATFHVGDRFPIQTSAFIGQQGAIPSISYEDLGVNIKVTPTVHSSEEVTLEVEADVKVLTGGSINGLPIIANRLLKSKVRVGTEDWMLVGGLLTPAESRNIAGVAGLSRIPYLGALFGIRERVSSLTQALILIRPRVVSGKPSIPGHQFYVGSDTRPLTPL